MFHAKKFGLLVGVLAVVLSLVLPTVVQAQAITTRPPLSLTTSPIPLNVVTKPGKTVTVDIRVKNNSNVTEKLKIELLKFGANGESGNPQLHEREAKDTYFDWVSFSEKTFTSEPSVWKTIKMTIKTPPDAAFGYYLAVLFSRAVPDKPRGGASAVEGGVASLVLLDVEAPGASRTAKVVSLTADRKIYEYLPANLNIRLKNTGNVHVAPVGSIFVKQGSKQVAVLDFNTQRGNILPASSRQFSVPWKDGFPYYDVKTVGTKTTKTLKWDFSQVQKLRFGRYNATLVAVYDDGQRDIPIEATVGFWVFPWRIFGVLLIVVLLAGVGIWMILRSIWKKIKRTPSKKSGDKDDSDGDSSSKDDATDNVITEAKPEPKAKAAKPKPRPKKLTNNSSTTTLSAPPVPEKTKTAPELKD